MSDITLTDPVFITVQKRHSICMAHRLLNHPGKCRNVHGHNYNITYTVAGKFDSTTGMIIDFGVIKRGVCAAVESMYDHKILLQDGDPLAAAIENEQGESTVVTMPNPPTAENMAGQIMIVAQAVLPKGLFIVCVEVEETAGACAKVTKILE